MSWQDVAVVQLRHAINDVDDPQRYTDSRLSLAWLVGANYVVQEFTLANKYTVDLVGVNINPDPTLAGVDPWMTNLTTLRTAIIMIGNDFKLSANSAYNIRDVHMQADLREIYKANKIILDEAKEQYEFIRMQYCLGVQPQLAAILTPINVLAGGYRAPLYGFDTRDRLLF